MERYRPEMRKYYYDPTRYKTYLEQLGISVSDGEEVDGSRLAAHWPSGLARTHANVRLRRS